jgi:hypothetical protein
MDELWGCFKHIGMSWDMIMKLPIQDRRNLIYKHNIEQEETNKENNNERGDSTTRYYEGESINTFARMEQSNMRKGGL